MSIYYTDIFIMIHLLVSDSLSIHMYTLATVSSKHYVQGDTHPLSNTQQLSRIPCWPSRQKQSVAASEKCSTWPIRWKPVKMGMRTKPQTQPQTWPQRIRNKNLFVLHTYIHTYIHTFSSQICFTFLL